MVHWTSEEEFAITSIWGNVDVHEEGHDTLTRLMVVYPWTKKYFSSFGNLSTTSTIASNDRVQAHGAKVLTAIGDALVDLPNIKQNLTDLSRLHSEILHVDPENFRLLGQCLVIVLAAKFGAEKFNADVQAAWQKLMGVIAAGLSKQYH
ncbi:hemoglobin subunit beta-2-like [Protopterus annectens]|uniref:hemoglobin subunit beta-2-like n=1 Tax=Protopterus annectens TaxID=7888 RepID=UPI001CFBC3ED|nr:hemoglobin subunit beta-2-like [Protopterus annectens]